MIPVALIVTTRNEAPNIGKCLLSAAGFFEEIFVIDSESEDDTCAIAKSYAAHVVSLPYVHKAIIPWIYQWGLDNLPIRSDWVMILEADQEVTPELKNELDSLFHQGTIPEDGFYVRRRQIFRGRLLRFGGYGSKYMLKLFRRGAGELDKDEQDTRVYVSGKTRKLRGAILENNAKESEILFYLQKHLRYAEAFAREEYQRRQNGQRWKLEARLFGTPDQRVLWLKGKYYRLPLHLRAFGYFFYRYIWLLGFLDGKEGAVFHFLQAFWFRLIVDIRLAELMRIGQDEGENDTRAARSSP